MNILIHTKTNHICISRIYMDMFFTLRYICIESIYLCTFISYQNGFSNYIFNKLIKLNLRIKK